MKFTGNQCDLKKILYLFCNQYCNLLKFKNAFPLASFLIQKRGCIVVKFTVSRASNQDITITAKQREFTFLLYYFLVKRMILYQDQISINIPSIRVLKSRRLYIPTYIGTERARDIDT